MQKQLTKCNFCSHWSGSQCTAAPNSFYCKEALDEYYAWKNSQRPKYQQGVVKSVYEKNRERRKK
jgi:hypothetical protein